MAGLLLGDRSLQAADDALSRFCTSPEVWEAQREAFAVFLACGSAALVAEPAQATAPAKVVRSCSGVMAPIDAGAEESVPAGPPATTCPPTAAQQPELQRSSAHRKEPADGAATRVPKDVGNSPSAPAPGKPAAPGGSGRRLSKGAQSGRGGEAGASEGPAANAGVGRRAGRQQAEEPPPRPVGPAAPNAPPAPPGVPPRGRREAPAADPERRRHAGASPLPLDGKAQVSAAREDARAKPGRAAHTEVEARRAAPPRRRVPQ